MLDYSKRFVSKSAFLFSFYAWMIIKDFVEEDLLSRIVDDNFLEFCVERSVFNCSLSNQLTQRNVNKHKARVNNTRARFINHRYDIPSYKSSNNFPPIVLTRSWKIIY